MLRHALIAGGIAMIAASGPALAQSDDNPNSTETSDRNPGADRGEPDARRGPPESSRGGDDRRPRPHGPPGPMMMGEAMTGFVLDLGDDRSLRVFCGDEAIGPCMEAVRPLIDQIPALTND
ncbi:hypothetical protein [Palleronia sp. LCG004]|uniref:hypothetical protein n=1 Tax=Palleronia sp. LCG004 TaxID=3079304 RepID=UPI0029422189|nr:hypothetical protein [Palleronia sp. LCG004]WOI56893.1 hypothetical protein RVY76_03610 [Palleronia sp. LCG004]